MEDFTSTLRLFSQIFGNSSLTRIFRIKTYTVPAPTSGDFFFRIRAVNDDGARGPWSNVEDITITGGLPQPPIPGFPIEAIALGAIGALTLGVLYRRRKR